MMSLKGIESILFLKKWLEKKFAGICTAVACFPNILDAAAVLSLKIFCLKIK
jgi:hypothetical protein